MKRSVFDLHCDTALAMYRDHSGFYQNNCHISASLVANYRHFGQVAAVFCPHELTDEQGWEQCFHVISYLRSHLDDCAQIISCGKDISTVWDTEKTALILAVEDARILSGKLERLQQLYDAGIRILTLLWADDTCIGGSHNTENGLTPFGKQVVHTCFERGIVPDVSHASEKSTQEIIEIATEAGKPCIASHSNALAVNPRHSRNLRDCHFDAIRDLGGVVGLNLCPDHLGSHSIEQILLHAEHYLERDGIRTVCLGCDFDGTNLPDGIHDVSDLEKIAELFAKHGYSDELIDRIFYRNAMDFLIKNLKS